MKRWLPLLALVLLVVLALAMGLRRHLSWAALAANPSLAAFAFMAIQVVAVAWSMPGAVVPGLAGGLLFGTAFGGLLVTRCATAGTHA